MPMSVAVTLVCVPMSVSVSMSRAIHCLQWEIPGRSIFLGVCVRVVGEPVAESGYKAHVDNGIAGAVLDALVAPPAAGRGPYPLRIVVSTPTYTYDTALTQLFFLKTTKKQQIGQAEEAA
jgi:hypothetical protein